MNQTPEMVLFSSSCTGHYTIEWLHRQGKKSTHTEKNRFLAQKGVFHMKLYQVSLNSINMVKQFIDVTTVQDCEIDVLSGRYVVDGKSIMALFSIDLNRPVNVRFHGSDEESQKFLAQAQAEGLTIVEIAEL